MEHPLTLLTTYNVNFTIKDKIREHVKKIKIYRKERREKTVSAKKKK